MTLQQALHSFVEWRSLKNRPRTIIGYHQNLVHFGVYMRDSQVQMEKITLQDCINYLTLCRDIGYHENTINKAAIALKLLFEYLERRGISTVNSDLIPIPKKQFSFPRVANEEDYKKLLSVVPVTNPVGGGVCTWGVRDKAMLMMLWDTGARAGELMSLDIEDIDLDRMSAKLKTEKSRGTFPFREVFWRKNTNEALGQWLDVRDSCFKDQAMVDPGAVFVGIKPGNCQTKSNGRRMRNSYPSEILRKYSNRAGLEFNFNPHSCRHHMGRDLARKGANAYAISSLLGHTNVSSSYPYTMMFGKDREDMYREKIGE